MQYAVCRRQAEGSRAKDVTCNTFICFKEETETSPSLKVEEEADKTFPRSPTSPKVKPRFPPFISLFMMQIKDR